ncbi:Catsper1 [Symbiodinium sp. CCMP2456]|nr:Catsper1 [Symbiodinium sp. CCMP2456]
MTGPFPPLFMMQGSSGDTAKAHCRSSCQTRRFADRAMERDDFIRLLDSCWSEFRQKAITAYSSQAIATCPEPAPRVRAWEGAWCEIDDELVTATASARLVGKDFRPSGSLKRAMGSENVSEIDTELVALSTTSGNLRSALKKMETAEALATSQRLRLRLGVLPHQKLISGQALHDAVGALGLTRYSLKETNALINAVGEYIGLHFKDDMSAAGSEVNFQDDIEFIGLEPVWQWLSTKSNDDPVASQEIPLDARRMKDVVPCQALMELFLAEEGQTHRKVFRTSSLLKQFQGMREILMASDANRLVAELTFVRINDLAAPCEPMHPLMYIEPFVAILILANGIMIGFQTDPMYEHWQGWIHIETAFAILLVLEILLRILVLRCRTYWCGSERYWNWFDVFLAVTSVTDLVFQYVGQQTRDIAGTGLLRFTKLIRLVRIVKVFRLKMMKDLRLMVKGWIAGLRTLVLAFTLLFTVLYVISGFATMALCDQLVSDVELLHHFEGIPASMFTAFRCFTGDCTSDQGMPLTSLLAAKFGLAFILPYVASYMLVTMGIFNVILAVYVEITMRAAKENDASSAEQYSRESIRVAKCARELLKKFATAYREFCYAHARPGEMDMMSAIAFTSESSEAVFTDDDVHDQIQITKEMFLVVIQDRGVQILMDELDLPPDRANLFEVIDADGSGTLHVQELVQGMLKIRGDITKSDTVATLLATKSLQTMIMDMQSEWAQTLKVLSHTLTEQEHQLHLQRSFEHRSEKPAEPHGCFKPKFPLSSLATAGPTKPEDAQEESENEFEFYTSQSTLDYWQA